MHDVSLWQTFAALGIPGIAFGVLYMLFRRFNWRISPVRSGWSGPSFFTLILIIGAIVALALYLWSPSPDVQKGEHSKSELIQTLDLRALSIERKMDADIKSIENNAAEVIRKIQKENGNLLPSPMGKEDRFLQKNDNKKLSELPRGRAEVEESPQQLVSRIAAETTEITSNIKNIKSNFLELHKQHIQALRQDNYILAREISNKIIKIIDVDYAEITRNNIGSSPGVYYHGYAKVWVDVRRVTQSGMPAYINNVNRGP